MTSAIFETGGKQYKVKEGDELYIEKLDAEDNAKVKFDAVLAIFNEDSSTIGSPYIKGATVTAKVIKSGKAKKIIVYKMLRRKGYRRKQGHRQPYTKVIIEKISQKSTEKSTDTKKEAVKEVKETAKTTEKVEKVEKAPAKATATKTATAKTTATKKATTKTAAKATDKSKED
jgi:large subunit ribosomal protein L21